jgi:hypothetical protein
MKSNKSRLFLMMLIGISLFTVIGCSCFMPSLNIPWDKHLSCSPDLQLVEHSTACSKLMGGDIQCTIEGTIENKGDGVAEDLRVRVEWSAEFDYVYWEPEPIGNLQPGQTADFEARFNGFRYPDRYDIFIECDSYK